MNMKMKVTNFLWLAICLTQSLSAQQGIVSSGGDILSSNGSVTYSVGQIAFLSINGETGNINPGLQQPFQFDFVGTGDYHSTYLYRLYPNPANQILSLQLFPDENIINGQDFFAKIYDVKGNLLINQRLRNAVNTILIGDLPDALYFVQIWQSDNLSQTIPFSKIN